VEAIKFRMEQQGLTRKDLETYIGTRDTGGRGAQSQAQFINRNDPPAA